LPIIIYNEFWHISAYDRSKLSATKCTYNISNRFPKINRYLLTLLCNYSLRELKLMHLYWLGFAINRRVHYSQGSGLNLSLTIGRCE